MRAKGLLPSRHEWSTLCAGNSRMRRKEAARHIPPECDINHPQKAAGTCARHSFEFGRKLPPKGFRFPALAECFRRWSSATAQRAGSGIFQTCFGQHEWPTPRNRSPHRPVQCIENLSNSQGETVGYASTGAPGSRPCTSAAHWVYAARNRAVNGHLQAEMD